jgi:protein-S-isoprenylcysteine O-methyltransferase Ste14
LPSESPIVQLFSLSTIIPDVAILEAMGTIVCAAGIAFAIWARVHLGRNWSSLPEVKEDHHLVTTGPYHFVRHPIYAGVLAAVLGSILVGGAVWFVVLLFVSIAFTYRMRKEEQLLATEFPGEYPQYRKRTKALIPFVW